MAAVDGEIKMTYNVFTAFTDRQKELFEENYMDHLYRRNGEINLDACQLSARERFFEELEANPVRRHGPSVVEQEVFERNAARRYPEPSLDEATLWALAMTKSNRLESYGIKYALSCLNQKVREPNDPLTYIELEENYHTRVLKNALEVVGLEMRLLPPPPTTRFLLKSMVRLPKAVTNTMILCTEVAGVGAFSMLRDKAHELFDDQPEPLQRLDEWFQQILVDEVCHVNYARSQLGPIRLKIAQAMLPAVAHGFINDMPEYKLLFGEKLMDRILAADVASVVADYNDKFLPAYN
ncbi:MAG: hypothetical protein Q8R47_01775 [Nanoarchaeota archaeon]|nr:hypothetical protein [Nanoarchaeota archaeon]